MLKSSITVTDSHSLLENSRLHQAPPGSTNDPENVHLVFLLVLDTKTAGRVWSGERGDWLPGSDRLESFAQCSQWSQWSQMSRQTKLSASLPTTWKLGKFLNDTKHHKMLHISFSPEKYQVRSSLLCYMNSENPRTRLRFLRIRWYENFIFLQVLFTDTTSTIFFISNSCQWCLMAIFSSRTIIISSRTCCYTDCHCCTSLPGKLEDWIFLI